MLPPRLQAARLFSPRKCAARSLLKQKCSKTVFFIIMCSVLQVTFTPTFFTTFFQNFCTNFARWCKEKCDISSSSFTLPRPSRSCPASGRPPFLPTDLTDHSPHYFQEIHIFFTIFKVSD
jgi:hypothetical protein